MGTMELMGPQWQQIVLTKVRYWVREDTKRRKERRK